MNLHSNGSFLSLAMLLAQLGLHEGSRCFGLWTAFPT